MHTDEQPHEDATERDRSADPVQGRRRWSRSVRCAVSAAAVMGTLLLVSVFVMQPFLIPSSSMEPTLQVGDRVLVNKLAYGFGNHPERGDVVVFDGRGSFVREEEQGGDPVVVLLRGAGSALGLVESAGTDYVKRVVGVGGDHVRCCDERGRIEVNGVPVDEDYLHPEDAPSAVPFDIRVPEGRLWMMGDRRSRSRDSRDHLGDPGGGMVPVERVIGRVDGIGWPPERWSSPDSGDGTRDGAGAGRRG